MHYTELIDGINVTKSITTLKLWLILLFIVSCNTDQNTKYPNTPTSGEVKVSVDETFKLLVETEAYTFQSLYSNAKLDLSYNSEAEAFNKLLKDSCKVIVASRSLNKKEKDYFESIKSYPKETKIAIDGIAIIINRKNSDSLISLEQLRKILTGKISSWKQVNGKNTLEKINVVFDNAGSSTVAYLKDSLLNGNQLSENCFAVQSNPEVIEYVNQHASAIGIIGVSWISDRDDPKSLSFLEKVRVVSLAGDNDKENYYKPYQAYLQLGNYPLTRSIYMINREPYNGLGTGFVSFVAGEKGQRIILKSGLVPATMPVRLVKINQ